MTPGPAVSVIIPVYNGARYLGDALDSVVAQSLRPREIIVVDDGSTDDSAEVARRYSEVCVISLEHCGQSAARNHALSVAEGDLIAFLDADDIWLPEKLSKQAEVLRTKPPLGYVLCRMRVFREPGCPMPESLNAEHYSGAPPANVPSALMVRKSIIEAVGPFDPALETSEDVDWFARANDLGIACETLDEVLLEKRIHRANTSMTRGTDYADLFQALRRSVARKHHDEGSP